MSLFSYLETLNYSCMKKYDILLSREKLFDENRQTQEKRSSTKFFLETIFDLELATEKKDYIFFTNKQCKGKDLELSMNHFSVSR